jgi:glycine cleavage system aminomethyltransferase T
VGIVTSGTFGPSVGEGIGLARVNPDVAVNGKALTVGPRRIPVESCGPPFYTGGSCRMKLE